MTFDIMVLYCVYLCPSLSDHEAQLAFFPLVATIGLSLMQGFMSYSQGKARSEAMADQAKLDLQQERERLRMEEQKKTDETMRLRDAKRRRRSSIEAAYAKSGVVMDGSAEELLVRQREADELNIQRLHWGINENKKYGHWAANQNYAQAISKSRTASRMADISLFDSFAEAGVKGVGMQSEYGFEKFSLGIGGATRNKEKFSWGQVWS